MTMTTITTTALHPPRVVRFFMNLSACRLTRSSTLSAHCRDGFHHLFTLLFSTLVRAQPLFCKFQCPFESGRRANLQQLDHASLVWSESSHLTDHFANQCRSSCEFSFTLDGPRCWFAPGDNETFV